MSAMGKPERSIFDEADAAADAAADAEGLADIEAGRVISHDAMKAWLLSWGTSGETPPPQIGD
jgi:predicted transcriptional regulator